MWCSRRWGVSPFRLQFDKRKTHMAQYVDIEQAVKMTGLRVTLPPGIPGPWGEALKGILYVKKIPYIRVRHDTTTDQLFQWTRQTSTPAIVYNDERPRTVWNDQLFLAERLAPEPALIPARIEDRIQMFGLTNELCGENGLGWSRRLMLVHGAATNPNTSEEARKGTLAFGGKYGYSPAAAAAAPGRVASIVKAFAAQLDEQRSRGSRFLVSDRLSALDIYWSAFAALIEPLPENLCAMTPAFRRVYTCNNPEIMAAVTPQLLAHRDFIYHEYLELPIDL
jgi:glutathione S-transferase